MTLGGNGHVSDSGNANVESLDRCINDISTRSPSVTPQLNVVDAAAAAAVVVDEAFDACSDTA